MQDGCVRIAAIVVAFALAAVVFRGRRSALVSGALAIALACDVAANVARENGTMLDVSIVATFVAACVLIADVVTARVRSVTIDASSQKEPREDRTSSDARA